MAIGINAVVIVGNLTRDPELRHTQGGTAVVGLRVAVNGSEKINGEWKDRSDFFDVRVWGNQGEGCVQYLAKGKRVGISGKLRLEEWESGGEKKQKVLIVADDVQFLTPRDGGGGERSAAFVPEGDFTVPSGDFTTGADADFGGGGTDDDIPF